MTDPPAATPQRQWTAREKELLSVTLKLLQHYGYERLTVDAVASGAKASKATVYRRWPSKAELVAAAVIDGIRCVIPVPETESLRDDLIVLGEALRQHTLVHACTLTAVLNELPHNDVLRLAVESELLQRATSMMDEVLARAVRRREITGVTLHGEIQDLLPGYLIFRALVSGRPPSASTVQTLVDTVLVPTLIGRK